MLYTSCSLCPDFYSCWKEPSTCAKRLKENTGEKKVCKDCKHQLSEYLFCTNPDCFYHTFSQEEEKTIKKLIFLENMKYLRNNKGVWK